MKSKATLYCFTCTILTCFFLTFASSLNAQITLAHLVDKIEKINFDVHSPKEQKSFPSLHRIIKQQNEAYSQSFFCNIESKIEKKTNFLVRFRLGSVDYVDRLEGKRDF